MSVNLGKSGRSRSANRAGILSRIIKFLERNRLGEILVMQGLITPQDLRVALAHQRTNNMSLGNALLSRGIVTRHDLNRALVHQWGLRVLATVATCAFAFSAFGPRDATAAGRDIPAQIQLASAANAAFSPLQSYQPMFDSSEKRSGNMSAFTKWSGMFARLDNQVNQPARQVTEAAWMKSLAPLSGLPLSQMATRVNSIINEVSYIEDKDNYGTSDYWATPLEFFARGGDCEDFAIAKYASLRALGVPAERLRVAIVQDTQKNIPHAVLIVYTDDDTLILDNQAQSVRSSHNMARYRPIFSLGENSWWLHTPSTGTIVASAD